MSAPFRVSNFRPMLARTLRGFVDVMMPSGMVLHRCVIFEKDGQRWIAPPSRPVVDRDGIAKRSADGKTFYEDTVSFKDRWVRQRWSDAVVAALLDAHRDAFDE